MYLYLYVTVWRQSKSYTWHVKTMLNYRSWIHCLIWLHYHWVFLLINVFKKTVLPKLQRYCIVVNQDLRFMPGLIFRTLKIKDFSSSLSAFKELFCNVEKLTLENVMEQKNIVPNIDQEGLNELTSLKLRSCEDMECLMDTTGEKGPQLYSLIWWN